jgi:hypothetical protein
MLLSTPRSLMLAAACCALASGCAQWQQQSDSYASALDQRLVAQYTGLFDESAPVEQASNQSAPARRAVTQASLDEPVMPTTDNFATAAEDVAPLAAPENSLAEPLPKKPVVAAVHQQPCDGCCEDGSELAGPTCPLGGRCEFCANRLVQGCREKLFTRPEPGPPPIRYRPPLPPKFLPVPTQPTLSPARPDAPEPWRGDVEMSFRPQLTFPARD